MLFKPSQIQATVSASAMCISTFCVVTQAQSPVPAEETLSSAHNYLWLCP